MNIRPRRSVLYMPGANERALKKAASLPADAIIMDLEDAVAPAAKDQARQQIADALKAIDYQHRERVVRINGLDTIWAEEDIAMVAESKADAICIPKVETAEQINGVLACLKKYRARADLPLWVMCETPTGVLNIQTIAQANPAVQVIVMGTSDLAKELRIAHYPDRAGFMVSLGLCLLAARSAGLDILDGVYLDLADEQGYKASCEQGKALGFDGKTLIHPKQLEVANQVFAPNKTEVKRAEKIITAWQEAEAAGLGVVLVDGKLVESLHVEEAQRLIDINNAISYFSQ